MSTYDDDLSLILAAEECEYEVFERIHKFSKNDERIIRKLIAHGPVLLQGGRGSGKSALMIETSLRLAPYNHQAQAIGFYISLRYVPLLKSEGVQYEQIFCKWVSSQIAQVLNQHPLMQEPSFQEVDNIHQLKLELSQLSIKENKRIILLFDDAAHIGRETSLGTFFDIFRILSSNTVSCKASIYPGVTEFGTRFDVYNDATVIDILRSPEQNGFVELFTEIMKVRYPSLSKIRLHGFTYDQLAKFLAIAVLGNMRAFIFSCNYILELYESNIENEASFSIGLNQLTKVFLHLASNYYWPLLEEVRPKLGKYIPAVEPAQQIAEILFQECAKNSLSSILIHRAIVVKYAKSIEILEYAGFIARREASRALKSGGRGILFAINLCNLLEKIQGARLTREFFDSWITFPNQFIEIHNRGEQFSSIIPPIPQETELAILEESIDKLKVSKTYPYGLTEKKIELLKNAKILTIQDLAEASDEKLYAIEGAGNAVVERFRLVATQALWM